MLVVPTCVRVALRVLFGGVLVLVLRAAGGADFGLPGAFFDDGIYNAVLVGSGLVCAARAVLGRSERLAWVLIGSGVLAWSAADLYYTAVLGKLEAPPFPSISDAGWLAFYPIMWSALVLLTRRRVRGFHRSLWLDGLVAALGVAAWIAALVLGPILRMSTRGDTAAVAVNLSYPVGDVLLLALLVGALALTGWRPDRSITLLGVGVSLSAVADLIYLDAVAAGQYDAPAWANAMWPAAALLIALAAWQPPAPARLVRLEGRRLLVLPITTMTAALALLFVDHFHRTSDLAAALACAALVMAGARLWMTLSEHMAMLGASRNEATTDPLTQLRNRRALVEDLDERVLRSSPEAPLLLLLCDLNGFKAYNDRFGHPAGDALLVRLGAALQRSIGDDGRVYRMGGDEFCVLASAPASEHAGLVARGREALNERGDGFEISAAFGTATIEDAGANWDDVLRDADRRMYEEKSGRRPSAGGQSSAVLLRLLSERHPHIGAHVTSVAALAGKVARELGMPDADQTVLWQAAALHDIGKAAVPDAILMKPGPLDETEWDFMRRHTEIGERILHGAPALAAAAPLVRSSHERFDGTGYPDHLAGVDIPVGARIVAVCDAYDAMTADRPFRRRMTDHSAVRELRRCAGTQFDPDVVDAFVAALARPSGSDPRAICADEPPQAAPTFD